MTASTRLHSISLGKPLVLLARGRWRQTLSETVTWPPDLVMKLNIIPADRSAHRAQNLQGEQKKTCRRGQRSHSKLLTPCLTLFIWRLAMSQQPWCRGLLSSYRRHTNICLLELVLTVTGMCVDIKQTKWGIPGREHSLGPSQKCLLLPPSTRVETF